MLIVGDSAKSDALGGVLGADHVAVLPGEGGVESGGIGDRRRELGHAREI